MFRRSLCLFVGLVLLSACATPATALPTVTPAPASAAGADLSGVKTYLINESDALHATIAQLQTASDNYYNLAQAANFDYAALWAARPDEVRQVIGQARSLFITSNPQYESMEGIVAGTPSLSHFDNALDAGTAGNAGGPDAVDFDLTLPDGRVLPQPGNLFEVTEAALWGSDPSLVIAGQQPDLDGDGQVSLGDAFPDANVLKAALDLFETQTADLHTAALNWQPTEAEAFGALVANVPTFSDFMDSWKNSRFVSGGAATERGFVSTSRLADLSDNITSWQTIYGGLSPRVKQTLPQQDTQITTGLADLQKYVSDLYAQEKAGKHFSPEEVDGLSAEGQNRATAIAGQVTQVAARLGVTLETP